MSTGQTPHLLDRVEAWCARITRPVAFIGVVGMLFVSGVTVLDVLARWLADSGVVALNEIVGVTFSVAIAACIPSGLARGVNLSVDVFEKRFGPRLAAWLGATGAAFLYLFFALLAWQMFVFAQGLALRHMTTVILAWPRAPFVYTVAVLLGAGALVQAVMAANAIRRARYVAPAAPGAVAPSALLTVAGWTLLAGLAALIAFGLADAASLAAWVKAHGTLSVLLAILLMWACLLGLMPLAAVMGLIGIAGAAQFIGMGPTFTAAVTEVSDFLNNSQVATLPLFLMMGSFAAVAGVSNDVYRLAHAVVGGFRGGLALATIGGCAGFGAVTGSSIATVATFGRVAMPEMRGRGYATPLAAGCVAAGGTLGAIVPPSSPLIIFALLTEASIGQLFIAAMGPALLAIGLYLVTIAVFVRVSPGACPPAARLEKGELGAALAQCGPVGALFGAVIGGMYFGVFTATEAAAIGAFGAFLVALARGKLRAGVFWSVIAETTASTAMIYGLIFGALIFSFFVAVTGLPEHAIQFIGGLRLSPLAVIVAILIVYTMLGSVMDSFAVMVITVPILTPLVLNMGYDILWWGIVILIVVETGMITPPFGLNVFVLKSTVRDVPLATIFRGVMPFVIADLVKLVLILAFPAIVLWLPSTMLK